MGTLVQPAPVVLTGRSSPLSTPVSGGGLGEFSTPSPPHHPPKRIDVDPRVSSFSVTTAGWCAFLVDESRDWSVKCPSLCVLASSSASMRRVIEVEVLVTVLVWPKSFAFRSEVCAD